MFYEKFKTLCEQKGVKPTPVIKTLGFSTSNLKRWQNGLLPNAEMSKNYLNISMSPLITC